MSSAFESRRLPRLLAGIPQSGHLGLAGHLDVHGPAPAPPARGRGVPPLVDEVERAGLRGRGGAGFPTALKMHAVCGARGKRRTVVVNAAEGEPASYKDRTLLGAVPHVVLDGASLAAQAIAASEVLLCVSEASAETARVARQAISERDHLRAEPPIAVVAVPATYVAGQESALVSHVGGGPAKPTFTPPMIFQRGVRGGPTLLSNAETFAHLALIARHGADWYRQLGTPEHPGSALVTLSGPVEYPGVYEIEHGASLASLIDAAGGLRESVRGILLGGYAGTWLDGSHVESLTLDDGCLATHGASTGAGVVALLGAGSCGVAETVRVVRWLARESAGQCGPCVHGLDALAARLEDLAAGGGEAHGAEIKRLAAVIRGRGACRHPDGTLRFIASAIDVYAEEFADHARHGPCEGCAAPAVLPLPRLAGERPLETAQPAR